MMQSVYQCVAVCYSVLQCDNILNAFDLVVQYIEENIFCFSRKHFLFQQCVCQYVAVCCSVLQCDNTLNIFHPRVFQC